jgi:predicted nucleotide-binding protein
MEVHMPLPIRTTFEDIQAVCGFLSKKPTGATPAEARKILDEKYLDGRKLAALKLWKLIDEQDGRLKITEDGRRIVRDEAGKVEILRRVVARVGAYRAVVERAHHRVEYSVSATEVAEHWHQHFKGDSSDSDRILNDQAVCFFQIAQNAGLGSLVVGRKGNATRFEFDRKVVGEFVDTEVLDEPTLINDELEEEEGVTELPATPFRDVQTNIPNAAAPPNQLGQAIFVAHGKNKTALTQLKTILDQFKIPYKVAIDEPNLGRPIGTKVREIMQACNCAILIFTADEEFQDSLGNKVWRPSENVVFELGASGYLYEKRIVIMKEDGVTFPTNFSDLGYISFSKDQLNAKAMDVLKELIGFGIVKVST